jgi:hypothetical protein
LARASPRTRIQRLGYHGGIRYAVASFDNHCRVARFRAATETRTMLFLASIGSVFRLTGESTTAQDPVQALHSSGEVWVASLDDVVEVIGHEAPRLQ